MSQTRSLCYFVYPSLCFAGLLWQLGLIIELYFQYRVNVRTTAFIEKSLQDLAVNFCTRWTDVIDYDRLNRETARNWSLPPNNSIIDYYQHELTVEEILKYTPQEETIVIFIRTRKMGRTQHVIYKDQAAREHCVVQKFIYLEYICYKISITDDPPKSYESLAITPTAPGLISQLSFSKIIQKSRRVRFALSRKGLKNHLFPYSGLKISPYFYRNFNESTGSADFNIYTISKYQMLATRLPPPYETQCLDYTKTPFPKQTMCWEECVKERSLTEFGKMPYSVFIKNISRHNIVSMQDTKQSTVITTERIENIEKNCSSKCSRIACEEILFVSTTQATPGDALTVRHVVPSQPSFRYNAVSLLNFVEFLTYLMSCTSTWTGFSMLSLNPFNCIKFLVVRIRKKQMKSRNNLFNSRPGINERSVSRRLNRLEACLQLHLYFSHRNEWLKDKHSFYL